MSTASVKKVIVAGGLGYIGSHVVLHLLASQQYQPIIIDNCHNAYPESLERVIRALAEETGKEFNKPIFHQADLREPRSIEGVFEQYQDQGGIWAVVHLAALKAVGESAEIPLEYYKVNVAGTVYLLEIMAKFNCRNFVFSSSATVYGEPAILPIPESSPLQGANVYGRTKIMCEEIIMDVCRASMNKGDAAMNAIALRYFNPAGAHPSGILGEDPAGIPSNLLPVLSQIASGKSKSKFKIFGSDYNTPDGTCIRDYLHVMDLANGHVLALDAIGKGAIFFSSDKGHFRAFNLGQGKGVSVLEMKDAMEKVSGYKYDYEMLPRRLGDVAEATADPSLAEKELGFSATRDLNTICRDLWKFQVQNDGK